MRNLDTGEAIHVSEIDERIAAGQQPQSLRPLARVPPPAGFLASLFSLGPVTVPLEPCLRPLPLLSIAGDLTNGSHLRLVVARDRFVAGDGLARALASVVRHVEWRRQKCTSEEGQLLRTCSAEESYVPNADDVGAMLSAVWLAADGLRLSAETSHVQVQPGTYTLTTDSLLALHALLCWPILCWRYPPYTPYSAGPTRLTRPTHSPDSTYCTRAGAARHARHDRELPGGGARLLRGAAPRQGAPPTSPPFPPTHPHTHCTHTHTRARAHTLLLAQVRHAAGTSWPAERLSGERKAQRALIRLDGHAKTVEVQRQEGRAWGRSRTRAFSRAVGVVLKPEDHNILTPLTFLLQMTDGSAYMMRASSAWERDLVALSLRTFLTEYPPLDMPPTPLLLEPLTVSVEDDSDDDEPASGAGGGGEAAAPTEPLSGVPLLGDPLVASTPRALHASSLEYGWYRTARNGVRALIRDAAGPSYCPTADDLGCMLSVEVTPRSEVTAAYSSGLQDAWSAAERHGGGGSSGSDSSEASVAHAPLG